MTSVEDVDQLWLHVQQAVAQDDFDLALTRITSFAMRAFVTSQRHRILCFGSATLDELCINLGKAICARISGASPRPGKALDAPVDLYIATELYDDGGHTPLIGDFVRNSGRHAQVVVTNIDNSLGEITQTVLEHIGLSASQIKLCAKKSLLEKFEWLSEIIIRLKPERIFLFNHPHDAVAISACASLADSRLHFVHHVDRNPCLGAFLNSALHIDVTPFCYHCCREKAGVIENVLIPLVADDHGCIPFDERPPRQCLTTASAGNQAKFRLDYEPSYVDAIVALLRSTGGRHIHIGTLPDEYIDRFRSGMRQAGITEDRVKFVPNVPSVWMAMLELGVDLFINSFPDRGARTCVEVMGSGTPILWHVSTAETLFHDTHMKYAEAATWQTLDDLSDFARNIEDDWLKHQSQFARQHYERYHEPGLMRRYLSEMPIAGLVRFDTTQFAKPELRSINEVVLLGEIDRREGSLDRQRLDLDRLRAELDRQRVDYEALAFAHRALLDERNALLHSSSWKVTAPLRCLKSFVARNLPYSNRNE